MQQEYCFSKVTNKLIVLGALIILFYMCKCVIEEIFEAPIVSRLHWLSLDWKSMIPLLSLCVHGMNIFRPSPDSLITVTSAVACFHQPKVFSYEKFLASNLAKTAQSESWSLKLQLSIFLAEIMCLWLEDPKHFPTCFQTKYRTPDAEPKGRKNFITLSGSGGSVRKNLGWLVWQLHSLTKWETHMFTKLEVNYTCWTLLNLYSLVLWLSLYVC